MKSLQRLRIIFVMIVAIGSILFLFMATKVSAENNGRSIANCAECNTVQVEQTNNEFIFLEAVTRYLVIAIKK